MPTLTEYDWGRPQLLDDLAQTEYRERQDAIARRWKYYRGEFAKPLKVRQNQPDDNITLNMARQIVSQSVYLLFGVPPRFDLPTPEDVEVHPSEEALDRIWAENQAELFSHNLAVDGSIGGHCYVKLILDPLRSDGVRLVRLDPSVVSVFWRPDDRDHVLAYKVQWTEGERTYRQDIVEADNGWQIIEMRKGRSDPSWTVTGEEPWPYPFAPIVDWQNLPNPSGYYGDSDLVNPGLNDVLNRVASNSNKIIRLHAHPKTIGIGMKSGDVQETAVDGFWAIPNPQANIFNLEMQSDLASSMAFQEFLQASFYSEHSAVDISSIKDRLGQLTNFGLHSLFWNALNKLRVKRLLYGNGLAEVSRRALTLAGHLDVPEPTVSWGDALPENRGEQVAAVANEMAAGIISHETAAEDLGRDWEVEAQRMDREATANAERNPATALLELYERQPGQPGPLQKRAGE